MLADLKRGLRHARRTIDRLAAVPRRARESLPFGLDWMRAYLPHYVPASPSRLHLDLCADLRDLHRTRGQWLDYVAPRESAKTTYLAKGYPLYCAVEGLEPFILELSDSGEQAGFYLDAIKQELESNWRLARDYPQACGVGPVWRGNLIRLRNGVAIAARGSGGRIRGLAHRSDRPSLVIVDDANEKGDAYSPTLRRRRWEWFTKDVMAVGTAATNFVVAGTPIHREAICHRLKSTPGWRVRSYRSLIRWPERLDLWAEWERLLTNLADAAARDTAWAFYEANRAAMDAGAEVLWPDRHNLYALMLWRAANGPAAFASEKQDEPGTDGATEWPAEFFDRPELWFEDWPTGLSLNLQALDPSKGMASKAGDWQAHGRLGLAADGTLYVEADLRREPITECVDRAIELFRSWGSRELIAESNNTMGLLAPEFERNLADRRKAGREVLCNYAEVYHTDPKLARIRCVGGYLARGQIRVRNTPGGRLLVEQWRDVPNGEFDDGPDAVATLVRRAEQLVNGGGT